MSGNSFPVVWCADRNSADNKPTAFALQGIHLQGDINEHHVLAVQELINAASKGRLLLPADGGFVLLNCGGTDVRSLIVSSNDKNVDNKERERIQSYLENKSCGERQDRPIFSINNANSDVLYEFLCCARCMNSEENKCCSNGSKVENLKIIERYLNVKTINAGKATIRRVGNHHHKPIKCRRKNKCSFKGDIRCIAIKRVGNYFPIYATVNMSKKNRERTSSSFCENEPVETKEKLASTEADTIKPPTLSDSFRKTSFDSTCTINSIDSGFIDMQCKGTRINKENHNQSPFRDSETQKLGKVLETLVKQEQQNAETNSLIGSWNRLTVPQQSRNRRKSYEEFKSLFSDGTNNSLMNCENAINKSRRKSYEEPKTVKNVMKKNNEASFSELTIIKNNFTTFASGDEIISNNILSHLRLGSKRFSQKNKNLIFNSVNKNEVFDLYDILKQTPNKEKNSKKQVIYAKKLELFEKHCKSECKVDNNKNRESKFKTKFNNIKSYGTIYDIIQNRSDITYEIEGKNYDKYMTYGTLYEILHRKSDEGL